MEENVKEYVKGAGHLGCHWTCWRHQAAGASHVEDGSAGRTWVWSVIELVQWIIRLTLHHTHQYMQCQG